MDQEIRKQPEPPDQGSEETVDEADTEGHSLLQAELHREIATSRSREASDWARGEAARRAAKDSKKRR